MAEAPVDTPTDTPTDTKSVSAQERALWVVNTIFHQFVAVLTVLIIGVAFTNHLTLDNLFTWHVLLCTLAYLPLMAEAIVLFAEDNVWSQYISRTTKYYIHGVFLLISAVAVTIGISFMIYEKGNAINHFESNHAIIGLVSWVLVLLSVFLGLFSAKAHELKNYLRPVYVKFTHNLLGTTAYVTGMVTLYYSFEYGVFKKHLSNTNIALMAYLLFAITLWSLVTPIKCFYYQIRAIVS